MRSYKFPRALVLVALTGLALGSGGCGPDKFEVAGKVTYNGAPLTKPDGKVVFIGADGKQVETSISADGTYRALGVLSGKNRVAVFVPNPAAKPDKSHKLKLGDKLPATAPPFLTPEKYASADTSELSVIVDKDTTNDIELTGPPIKLPK